MPRLIASAAFLIAMMACSPLPADEPSDSAGDDVLLRALVDELNRNMEKLELEDLDRPYFIEYSAADADGVHLVAQLGSLTTDESQRIRHAIAQVRVGSYELDNTNFGDESGGFGRMFGRGANWTDLPIEDDYAAIRQALWWSTDRQYKDVLEVLAQKQAYMKNKTIEDKPNDFARVEPAQHLEERIPASFDAEPARKLARQLSAVFAAYPELRQSHVQFIAGRGNEYLVNSEGTRLRQAGRVCFMEVIAEAQSEDGMILRDAFNVYAHELNEFPPAGDLNVRCRHLAETVIAAAKAPTLQSYSGPVLMDASAAAQVIAALLAPSLAGGQKPLGEDSRMAMLSAMSGQEDLSKKLGKRILPRFLNLIDDATQEKIDGISVLGSYKYDDQGVPARSVTLVEDGELKTLVMSRNPSKEIGESNGHGRRGMLGAGAVSAASACLIIRSDDPLAEDELKKQFIEACEEDDLEFGLRIKSMAALPGFEDPLARMSIMARLRPGRGPTFEPLGVYKVYVEDGREELVRGLEITSLDMKALRQALAVGDQPFVYNYFSAGLLAAGSAGSTVVTPAWLFEELDLSKPEGEHDKPPILPNPLAREES